MVKLFVVGDKEQNTQKYVLKASGSNGSKNKSGIFLTKGERGGNTCERE